jgi:hypothetical protein
MNERVLDRLKNALIVLLLLCIAVLTLMALPPGVVQSFRLPPEAMRLLGIPVNAEVRPVQSTQAATAAQPLLISVRSKAGRLTAQRSFAALDPMRERLTPLLVEALRTAAAPAAAETEEFYDALSREGVLFDYGAALPVSAVGDWLGAENPALSGAVRRFLLAERDGAVELYALGDACVRCATELSAAELSEALEAYQPDGSVFFAEEEEPRADVPELLMLRENAVALPNAVAEFPEEGNFAESVATLLNFNPYGSGVYTDADENYVFTENSRTCSVSPDGTVVFTDSEEAAGPEAAENTASAKIEAVRALAASIGALVPNDARLYLSAWEEEEDLTRCRFRYVLDGVPVVPDAVTATFSGVRLTEFRFAVRSCYTGAGHISLLPLPQAAAIAEPGKALTAAYHDSGRGTLSAGWVQN